MSGFGGLSEGRPSVLKTPSNLEPLRYGGTLNSGEAASPFLRLLEGEELWEAPDHPQASLKFGLEPIQIVKSAVWSLKLLLMTGVHLVLCHNGFGGPRSNAVRQKPFFQLQNQAVLQDILYWSCRTIPLTTSRRPVPFATDD
ncbi:hypothetical protein TNCV_1470561 [Trichonephila clavipes]|nr:hypothetical protein TNCV_1470561 [Trichonephila clavipes]